MSSLIQEELGVKLLLLSIERGELRWFRHLIEFLLIASLQRWSMHVQLIGGPVKDPGIANGIIYLLWPENASECSQDELERVAEERDVCCLGDLTMSKRQVCHVLDDGQSTPTHNIGVKSYRYKSYGIFEFISLFYFQYIDPVPEVQFCTRHTVNCKHSCPITIWLYLIAQQLRSTHASMCVASINSACCEWRHLLLHMRVASGS